MSRVTLKHQEKQEAITHLRELLRPGDRVFGIVKHVSRSGMSRNIDFYTFKDGDRAYLSGWIATALDERRDKSGAIIVAGCGMDMIFHVVYNLGRELFPEGFGMPCENCGNRAKDKEQARRWAESTSVACPIDNRPCSYRGRNGDRSGWDDDGGYALKHDQL